LNGTDAEQGAMGQDGATNDSPLAGWFSVIWACAGAASKIMAVNNAVRTAV